jgi:alkyl hydroperoxide reductase subunit AhpC
MLSDIQAKGKWTLMIFYPKDFTFVCPTELKTASILVPEFEKLNTQVVSFSTQDIQSHKDWVEADLGVMNFPMGYDKDGIIGDYFGIYDEENDVDWRGTFLIAPDGRLWATYTLADETGRSIKEMLRFVEAGQNAFEGKMVPCEWKPGMSFLKKD